MTAIPDWTDASNSFDHVTGDGFTHSTRDAVDGYVTGGAFASSEIQQEQAIPAGYEYGVAVLTFQRATIISGDTGRVYLEALSGSGGSVVATTDTGLETTTVDVWQRRRLSLSLPDGATHVRVRVVANRAAGSGSSGAAFDDFDLRIHKTLAPVYSFERSFTALPPQPTPATWQQFHLAWPDHALPELVMAHGVYGISVPQPISGEGLQWSDVTGLDASPFFGNFGESDQLASEIERTAYTFTAGGPHLQLFGNGSKRRGNFQRSESFTVRVVLKVRDIGSGCGVVGARDGSGVGWGIEITSGGLARAVLEGNSGTKTATSVARIDDGAPHQLVMVYSADDDTLRIYVDRRGYVETSTASGMGEFQTAITPAGTYPMRIGTSAAATDTFGGEMLELDLVKGTAYTEEQVSALWTYVGYDSIVSAQSHAVWVPVEANDDGVMLVRVATDQAPIGYLGSARGIATTFGSANLWTSNDVSSTSAWEAESTVTATRTGIVDPTGLAKGIRIAGDTTHGLVIPSIAIGASSGTVNLCVFARALSGTPSLSIALLSSADVSKDTDSFTMSTEWQLVPITALAWDGATSTCKLRFRCASTFELAHVAWCERADAAGARRPAVFQDAGVTLSNVYHTGDVEHPVRLNHEGEVDIEGVAANALPEALYVAAIGVTGDDTATRAIGCGSSQTPGALHYDSAEAFESAFGTAIDWSDEWRIRARWCRAGIPTDATDTFFGVVVTGSVNSDVQDARTAAWSVGSDPLDNTTIGTPLSCLDAYIRRFAVKSREPKLG